MVVYRKCHRWVVSVGLRIYSLSLSPCRLSKNRGTSTPTAGTMYLYTFKDLKVGLSWLGGSMACDVPLDLITTGFGGQSDFPSPHCESVVRGRMVCSVPGPALFAGLAPLQNVLGM